MYLSCFIALPFILNKGWPVDNYRWIPRSSEIKYLIFFTITEWSPTSDDFRRHPLLSNQSSSPQKIRKRHLDNETACFETTQNYSIRKKDSFPRSFGN
ncbi:hypothetical protein Y032_0009g539 [Ancylostoma ceylanicum]|uniref:Uncharacterized protein n=1 Tax=Ancylostoma ceylanicum TaxID=53326 RepID=A0A016VJD6_9BILA|nr:hypothetical protein Y032_0009g539 [Ancylostoma ceylanicum]